jgi:hypothetical protein
LCLMVVGGKCVMLVLPRGGWLVDPKAPQGTQDAPNLLTMECDGMGMRIRIG